MKHSQKGFTLIELTVVIAIMAVAVVVVVSKIDGAIPSARLDARCRTLCSFIESAFSKAAASGKPVCIVYDLNDQEYCLAFPKVGFDDDPSNLEKFAAHSLPRSIKIEKIAIGDEIETSGIHAVKANANGRIMGHSIFIEDADGRKKTIEVSPLTGVTTVYEDFVDLRDKLDVE